MWRRWGNSAPEASEPIQYSSHDDAENYLETIPEVDSRPQSRLPELPFRSLPPLSEMPQRESIYSQPSPIPSPTFASYLMPESHHLGLDTSAYYGHQTSEVSPISQRSSYDDEDNREGRAISPIEPASRMYARDPLPEPKRQSQSQIPRRKMVDTNEMLDRHQTKWDEYTGERTMDDHGKIGSTRPGAAPVELQYPQLKERTKLILAGLRERDAAKTQDDDLQSRRDVAPAVVDNSPPKREPWRGASGRTTLVDPVKDVPAARNGPLSLTQRNPVYAKQVEESFSAGKSQSTSSTFGFTARSVQPAEGPRHAKPVKITVKKPAQVSAASTSLQSPFQSPHPPTRGFDPDYDPYNYRTESPQYDPEPTTPTTPTQATTSAAMDKRPTTPKGLASQTVEDEVSRFSWSTYATTAAGSPQSIARMLRDDSPPPPVPAMATLIDVRKRYQSPYLHNSGAYSSGSVVTRKPIPKKSFPGERTQRGGKDLPPVPTELEAADKLGSMEAQLEALDRRKRNISRIIRDLENNLKQNAVIYDMYKRREIEKKVANHKLELDSVTQEAHDLGLHMHRAQKKRDRDDNYEMPTGLWIKRVTS